jgi:GNAT superfamily N-acetyltransferase
VIDPIVRRLEPARPGELDQLTLLEREARSALVDQRGGPQWLAEHPEVAMAWERRTSTAEVYVAVIDDVLVGYLVSVLGPDAVVRVDQVWVTPDARELGFGDELLATAIAEARTRGATAVEGQALPGDRQTKNLYERAGIVARLITTYRAF